VVCFNQYSRVGVPGSLRGLSVLLERSSEEDCSRCRSAPIFLEHSSEEDHGSHRSTPPFVAARQARGIQEEEEALCHEGATFASTHNGGGVA